LTDLEINFWIQIIASNFLEDGIVVFLDLKTTQVCDLMMSVLVFWVVKPCGLVGRYQRFEGTFSPEDGDSIFLRNVGIYLQVHTALQPRRLISATPDCLAIFILYVCVMALEQWTSRRCPLDAIFSHRRTTGDTKEQSLLLVTEHRPLQPRKHVRPSALIFCVSYIFQHEKGFT
jgi:hypothetical protein